MVLRVSLPCGATDRTMPLITGDVRPAGIDLTFLPMYPEEVFWRMTRHAEFDAAEMSLSSYLLRRSRDDDAVMAIPVFTSREFRHSCVWVRSDARIRTPADLIGKRMGVPEYQMTAAVWIRGFLSDDFAVRPADMRWFSGGLYEPGREEKLPISIPGVEINAIGPDQTLSRLLADGQLDAIMGPRPPSGFPGPNVTRLFPDFKSVEIDYFKRTAVFPIMHTVVLRRELREDTFGLHFGRLGHDGDGRSALDRGQLASQVPVAGADRVAGRDAEADHVDFGQGRADQAVQPFPEQRARLVQAGRVDQDQLGVRPVHDAADHMAGGLRPITGDRHLGADQRVRQRRLADVRTAGETGKPGPERGG